MLELGAAHERPVAVIPVGAAADHGRVEAVGPVVEAAAHELVSPKTGLLLTTALLVPPATNDRVAANVLLLPVIRPTLVVQVCSSPMTMLCEPVLVSFIGKLCSSVG